MIKEIGSNFWLNTELSFNKKRTLDIQLFGLYGIDYVLLSSGRSAISFVLSDIDNFFLNTKKVAIVPAFTCDTVLQPFYNANYEVYAYNTDAELMLTGKVLDDVLKKSRAKVVLIHRYFGFDTTDDVESVIAQYRNNGVIFIEDKTQCLLSSFHSLNVDYIVGSFRKWGPIPDGGFCISTTHCFSNKPIITDDCLVSTKLNAFNMKYEYMELNVDNKDVFLQKFRDAELLLQKEQDFFRMSDESISIIQSIDFLHVVSRRRENYQYLFQALNQKKVRLLTGKLDKGICPLYIALFLQERNELQAYLRENKIYAPIIWPKPLVLPAIDSCVEEIYQHALCIPIDQRYTEKDMQKIVKVIDKALNALSEK
jgi:dTDP-4-amino-4,6-dideoxygalactose transaminase